MCWNDHRKDEEKELKTRDKYSYERKTVGGTTLEEHKLMTTGDRKMFSDVKYRWIDGILIL